VLFEGDTMSRKGRLPAVTVVAGTLLLASSGWSRADLREMETGPSSKVAAPDRPVPAIRVLVDPRIEVIGIVFRLAGYPEYLMGRVQPYTSALDAHFARYTDHPVVARARALRKTRGISFNAPISLAVHLTNPPALAERVPLDPLPAGVDPRWTPVEARAFLVDLRSFVREARVMEFLAGHAALYQTAAERLQSLARGAHIVEWLEDMFGGRENREFVLVGGLLNGGGNYGAMVRGVMSGGPPAGAASVDEFFAIIGTEAIDERGLPSYPPRVAATVAHEFSHSFVNPLVDAHEADLEKAANGLFSLAETRMRSQGYGLPRVTMYESLVRACTVRYLSKHVGADAARREVALDRARGFAWVGPLADTLLEYERDRSRYPTLEAFVPRLVAFFEDYSRAGADDLRAIEAEQEVRTEALAAKGPKVVSMSPAHGATDVDAASVVAITVSFDRPMREGNFALFPVQQAALPVLKGPPRFDASGRTITLSCELKPGVTYGLQFNSPEHMAFSDIEGNPLAPFVYRFTTRR
jgi:hypothetical protein